MKERRSERKRFLILRIGGSVEERMEKKIEQKKGSANGEKSNDQSGDRKFPGDALGKSIRRAVKSNPDERNEKNPPKCEQDHRIVEV
jgi:hypothetical protein